MQPTTNQTVPAIPSVPAQVFIGQAQIKQGAPMPLDEAALRQVGGGQSAPNTNW